jgi:hypothetical protein
MDSSTIDEMASRLAGRSALGTASPSIDPLSELERLIGECRQSVSQVAAGVAEGRLSEESLTRLWGSLQEKARSACEGLRSCKSEMDAVLPRTRTVGLPPGMERFPA